MPRASKREFVYQLLFSDVPISKGSIVWDGEGRVVGVVDSSLKPNFPLVGASCWRWYKVQVKGPVCMRSEKVPSVSKKRKKTVGRKHVMKAGM